MTDAMLPITERTNPLTYEIDVADPIGIVRLLRQVDAQVFAGAGTEPALADASIMRGCLPVIRALADAIRAGESGSIVLAGAGTSGRIAQLLARQFNRILRARHAPEVIRPLIAGGAAALVKAQEGAEDNPALGVEDLRGSIPEAAKTATYVGITCGFSAAYVAGQLDALLKDERVTTVLVGFNRAEEARRNPIEGWDKTFADVLATATASPRFHLLNPIYGPEAITGSTRMKGATATKVLLESCLYVALEIAGLATVPENRKPLDPTDDASLIDRLRRCFERYRAAMVAAYVHAEELAGLVRFAGAALRTGGRISMVGRDTAGILALVDASECPPTFGAGFQDVRGYLRSGWKELLDEERDLSGNGPEYRIDHEAFEHDVLSTLSKGDLVLAVSIGEIGPNTRRLMEAAIKTRATCAALLVGTVRPKADDLPAGLEHLFYVEVPSLGFQPGGFFNEAELALKLCLNAMSTGAFVQIGKVYHNQMIDLRISNQKLYLRAIETIARLANIDEEAARLALLRAVLKTDKLDEKEAATTPSQVVRMAANRPRIVPIALLLATGKVGYFEADEMLGRDPIVRRVIEKVLR